MTDQLVPFDDHEITLTRKDWRFLVAWSQRYIEGDEIDPEWAKQRRAARKARMGEEFSEEAVDRVENAWWHDHSDPLHEELKRYEARRGRAFTDADHEIHSKLLWRLRRGGLPITNRTLLNRFAEDDETDLVKGLVKVGEYGVIGAPARTGKSQLMCELAVAVSTGTPFMGRKEFDVAEPGDVLIFYPEGEVGLRRRLDYFYRARGYAGMADPRLDDVGAQVLAYTGHLNINTRASLDKVAKTLEGCQPRLVLIDSIYMYLGGMEGSNQNELGDVMGRFFNTVQQHGDAATWVSTRGRKNADVKHVTDLSGSGWTSWCNDWILLSPKSEFGAEPLEFFLRASGRDWGGVSIDLDVSMSDGVWTTSEGALDAARLRDESPVDACKRVILTALAEAPGTTRTAVAKSVGGNAKVFSDAWTELKAQAHIAEESRGNWFVQESELVEA